MGELLPMPSERVVRILTGRSSGLGMYPSSLRLSRNANVSIYLYCKWSERWGVFYRYGNATPYRMAIIYTVHGRRW